MARDRIDEFKEACAKGVPLRQHITDAARQAIELRAEHPSIASGAVNAAAEWCRPHGLMLVTVEEWNDRAGSARSAIAAKLVDEIARLQDECDSLSRQMRSREINRDPAITKPVFRWGRPV